MPQNKPGTVTAPKSRTRHSPAPGYLARMGASQRDIEGWGETLSAQRAAAPAMAGVSLALFPPPLGWGR